MIINVTSLVDSQAVIAYCWPESNSLCNLRSAWAACNNFTDSQQQCTINLPNSSSIPIDVFAYGWLELLATSNIAVEGNGAMLMHDGSAPLNEPVYSEIPALGSFPETGFLTGALNNTADATQNFATGSVLGCPGETLSFTSCEGGGSGDSYLSLYDSSGEQVASNDDSCGVLSEITFTGEK
jgi:hypothetical protein